MNASRNTQEREQTHPRGLAARGIGKVVWGCRAILLGIASSLIVANASAIAPVSQPPTISITSPYYGTSYTSAQTVTITASATDNRGVAKVEFYDGGVLKGTDTASPYTWAWAFTSANNGTHSWTAKAYDTDGNTTVSSPVSLTVNIAVSRASATTTAASSITLSTATANGTANPNGSATTVFFQYGTTTSYGGTTASQSLGSGTSAMSISAGLSGLAASTTYHYRLVASNNGGTSYGADVIFTTSASSSAPVATTASASNIGINTATSNGTADPNGSTTTAYFQYGTTTAYGSTSASQSAGSGMTPMSVAANLGALSPSTTYHYRTVASNSMGTSYGADMSFTTAASSSSYTIATTSSPTAGGSTSGAGIKTSGTVATVSASPSSGYSFVRWTENGVQVSTSATYSFTVTGSRQLVANFSATSASYTVATSSSPAAGGSTSGAGIKTSGTTVTVLATPNGGYAFANWTEGGTVVSTSASYSFTASVNRTLVANFTTSTGYTITTSSSPTAGGTTSGGGTKSSGAAVTVVATVSSGYSFVNWTENGVVWSTSTSYSFTANGNRNLVANFSATTSSGQWAMDIGGPGTDLGNSVATDASGNVVVAGYFNGSVNFGNTTLTSAGGADIFVAKYSPSGAPLWAVRFGGTSDDQAFSVAVDKRNGEVAVGGYFNSPSITIGTNTLTQFQGKDGFVARLSGSSGQPLWARAIAGHISTAYPDDVVNGVSVNPGNGDVWVTGQVQGYVDFGQRAQGGDWVTTDGQTAHTFLARYAATGVFLSATMVGGTGVDYGSTVVATANNVYVVGSTNHGANLGTTNLVYNAFANYVTFVAKYSSTGVNIWGKLITASQAFSFGTAGLAVDGNGDVFIAGSIPSSSTIDLGNGVVLANANATANACIAKLSGTNGGGIWGRTVSSTSGSGCMQATVDSVGNVVASGVYQTGSTLTLSGTVLTNAGGRDAFLVKYSAAGSLIWAKGFGGASDDSSYAVAVDPSNNILSTGYTFGGKFGGVTLPSVGGADIFLMKLAP